MSALLIVLIITFLFSPSCSQPTTPPANPPNDLPKAAIIDQLYSIQPNEDFISEVTQQLEGHGFVVDLYQGDEITVDFYRELPVYGYKLILFRTHSGLLFHRRDSQIEVTKATCLFTNEPYSERKHIKEQLNGELARARIREGYPIVFGIGARFTKHSMEGEFDNTVIIMMGCSCLYLDDLAQAFITKGASAYLAWDATVDLDYVDEAAPYLIRQLCVDKVTVGKAVASTMNVVGPDPKHGAKLKYYPPQSGDKTLKELFSF